SHLDYLTQIPLLHRIFDPDVIISVVNDFLERDPVRYGTKPQPQAEVGVLGRRALPSLNGLTRGEALAIVSAKGLSVAGEWVEPLITASAPLPGARLVSGVLERWARWGKFPEVLIGHVALRLVRPGGEGNRMPTDRQPASKPTPPPVQVDR